MKAKDLPKVLPKIALFLYQWSEAYAHRERICELAKVPFDTRIMDSLLSKGAIPRTFGKTIVAMVDNIAVIHPLNGPDDLDIDLAGEKYLLERIRNEFKFNKEGEK